MMVSAETRATAVVRRLRVGDKFNDGTGNYEVMRPPVVTSDNQVQIYVRAYPDGKQTRAYLYDYKALVTIVR